MITYHQRYAPRLASLIGLQTLIPTQALKLTGRTPEGVGEVFGISARDAIDLDRIEESLPGMFELRHAFT
ncbi:MAG: hypothetical protein OXN80_02340 [bacterium]|nr:hypothetical protein [bacterium]